MEELGRGLMLRYYPGIYLEGLRKPTEILIRIAVTVAENRAEDLPNTKLECLPLDCDVR
jgi:hypothetical protein